MKPKLENLKEYTSKASLTSEEKFDMFQNIRAYSNTHPVHSRYSIFMKHSLAYASMFALLITTAGTSFAAEDSLPGDILYPVKTNVNEGVIKSFTFSETQKAKVTVNLMDRRMQELEKLIVTKQDSPENVDIIVNKLEEHKEDLQEFANQVDPVEPQEVQDARDIYTELESVMDTHVDILQDIALNQDLSPDVHTLVNTLTKEPSEQEATSTPIETQSEPAVTPASSTEASEDSISTQEEATSTLEHIQTVTDIVNFTNTLEPLFVSTHTEDSQQDEENKNKIREETRKRVIENAEDELEIDVE
jgi:hypothetical protein